MNDEVKGAAMGGKILKGWFPKNYIEKPAPSTIALAKLVAETDCSEPDIEQLVKDIALSGD